MSPERLELPAFRLEGERSIHLSYGDWLKQSKRLYLIKNKQACLFELPAFRLEVRQLADLSTWPLQF